MKKAVLVLATLVMFSQLSMAQRRGNGGGYGGPDQNPESIPVRTEHGYTADELNSAITTCVGKHVVDKLHLEVYNSNFKSNFNSDGNIVYYRNNKDLKILVMDLVCTDQNWGTVCTYGPGSKGIFLHLQNPDSKTKQVTLLAELPRIAYVSSQIEKKIDMWGNETANPEVFTGLSILRSSSEKLFNINGNETTLSYSQDALIACLSTELQKAAQ